MGVFGVGLYSGDFAMDLRSTVGAVARLPFEAERLVELVCECEPGAARDPADEDHTTLWLVLADQFSKRGIESARVRDAALRIIDNGLDLARLEKLGMKTTDLRKRKAMLEELRVRLISAVVKKARPVLKSPQPLLMLVGGVYVYPTCGGDCINPYFPSKDKYKFYRADGSVSWEWKQDGWGSMLIVDCGRAFEFLAWYRPLLLARAADEKPTMESLRGGLSWKLGRAGTCSKSHFTRMELEKIGELPLDRDKVRTCFPGMKPGTRQAIQDISIANAMRIVPAGASSMANKAEEEVARRLMAREPTISDLSEILAG